MVVLCKDKKKTSFSKPRSTALSSLPPWLQVVTGSTGRQDNGQVVDFQIRIWSPSGQQ
ncbi:unnamed protein product, partial [Discosporangium mesarthrocarpum]